MGLSKLFKEALKNSSLPLTILMSVLGAALLVPSVSADQVKHFPGGFVLDAKSYKSESYQLILGQLKRIRGVMIPEKYQYVDATRETETYEIPKGRDVDDVYDHYLQQIKGFQTKVLFECAGRGCGPANDWANKVFKEAKLYGPERFQHYSVLNRGKTVWVLYVSQRGNRTVMAHIEKLRLATPLIVQAPEINTLVKKLETNDRILVPGFSIIGKQLDVQASKKGLEALETAIRQYPDKKLAVVVHVNNGGGTSAQLADVSQSVAKQIESILKQEGLRIHTLGVGPYTARYQKPYVIELVAF